MDIYLKYHKFLLVSKSLFNFTLKLPKLQVTYQDKKSKINVKEQNFEQKGEIKIRIRYDVKKDKSTIITKEPKEEKIKEVKDGQVILKLNTNHGKLEAIY